MAGYEIFLALGLTLILEIPFFIILGFRGKYFVLIFLLINVATNLTLNIIIYYLRILIGEINIYYFIIPLEIIVTLIEWLVYRTFLDKRKNLLIATILANAFSFGIGLIVF